MAGQDAMQGLILLRADQFGLPQRRKRLFIIGINNDRAMEELLDTPEQMLHSVINTFLPAMKVENPPVVPRPKFCLRMIAAEIHSLVQLY